MATTVEHMRPEAATAVGPPAAAPEDTAPPPAPATPHETAPPAAPAAVGGATPDDTTRPVALDTETLKHLAAVFRADQQRTRPTWQSSLLVAMAGALLAIAGGGFFSLRSDIATLGTSLRTEIRAVDDSLRAEIGSLRAEMQAGDEALRAEIGTLRTEMIAGDNALRTEIVSLRTEIAAADESLRAELREFRAEFNKVALDHTQRLTRLEAAHPGPDAQ